jgi:hypothetical protein
MRSLTIADIIRPLTVALALIVVCASASTIHAQTWTGVGLITAVDLANNTLVLETRSGPQCIRVAPAAAIRGDHGAVLTLRDLGPGDAVAYSMASDSATRLQVARQFWALPAEW